MKTKHLFLMLSACTALLTLFAFITRVDDPLDKLVASLQKWTETNPQEKIYLHTDRPYYLVGDTIWFKAYVTIGSKHQLSRVSGAMYVDIINEGDSIALSLKLPMLQGMSLGSFALPDSVIHEGNYRIRAYTQWMRNAGPEYFYDRTFTIGNALTDRVFSKIDYVYTKDGNKTRIQAILTYTDEKGNPFVDKPVKYLLKEGYNVISSGGGKTDANGQFSINLPNTKPGVLGSSHLLTGLTIDRDEVVSKTFPIKTAAVQTDVQFFPESGALVNGVKSKVAFKATATNGLGTAINGVITDNYNTEIAKLEVKHLGMGYFFITPQAGKTYQARVTYADGSTNSLPLPAAVDDGYVLSVYHTGGNDSLMVRVTAGKAAMQKGPHTLSLIGQQGGTPYFALHVPVKTAITTIPLVVKDLPTGIMQFTLFSADGVPLNERLAFIQSKDVIDVKISSTKPVYHTREKVDLTVTAKNNAGAPVGGSFSMSVIAESAVATQEVNETSIFSQLLLSADIKGYIEKPNYYFYNQNDETFANLDVLMLTQGYRRFNWKTLDEVNAATPAFKAEKIANQVTGRLTNLGNKPIAGGKILMANNKLKLIIDTVTDAEGRFKFTNLFITKGIEFTIQGRNPKGGDKVMVTVDKPSDPPLLANHNIGDINADIPALLQPVIKNNDALDIELTRQGKLSDLHQLREVKIKSQTKRQYGGGIAESQADEVYRPDTRQPCTTLRECLTEAYKSRVRFTSTFHEDCGPIYIPTGYQVIVNGVLVQPCEYQSIFDESPENILKIYVVRDSPAIIAQLAGSALHNRMSSKPSPTIVIFTKKPNWRKIYDPSIMAYDPKGYDSIKEFYSPKYDNPDFNRSVGDIRSTIYWNANVLTRAIGQANVSYYNADRTGTYRVTVEGINAAGQLARQVYRYKVE